MVIKTVKKINDETENILDGYMVTYVNTNKIKSVPLDPDNTDYQEIQKWVAAGNKIEDAD
tara:strand:- start:83 stop:262 length:180 start_codon:yes stop_codon:yes gene_type:complete